MSDLFGGLPAQVSLSDQIRCVEREIAMRAKVYPRWVENGRLTPGKADAEMGAMTNAVNGLAKACTKKFAVR